MCGNWEGVGHRVGVVWEEGEAKIEFLGAANLRQGHSVSPQRLCMAIWPLDSGTPPVVPMTL